MSSRRFLSGKNHGKKPVKTGVCSSAKCTSRGGNVSLQTSCKGHPTRLDPSREVPLSYAVSVPRAGLACGVIFLFALLAAVRKRQVAVQGCTSLVYGRTVKVASVAERVIDIVAEQLGVDKEKITPETSFVNDLGADSLDTVELVMELEEEFDINIPDDAAEKIQTVGQAIKFIEEAQKS